MDTIPPFDVILSYEQPPPFPEDLSDQLRTLVDFDDNAYKLLNTTRKRTVLIRAPPKTVRVDKTELGEYWTDFTFIEKGANLK